MFKYVMSLCFVGITVVSAAGFDSCVVCTSASDPDSCLNPSNLDNISYKNCSAPADNNSTCYSRIIDGHLERGCATNLNREDRAACKNETSCELCFDLEKGGQCNTEIFPKHRLQCHMCEGHVNDTCGRPITAAPSICKLYDPTDRCFTSIVGDLVTRGCTSGNMYCKTEAGACKVCDGHGCNSKHYSSAFSAVISKYTIVSALCATFVFGMLKL